MIHPNYVLITTGNRVRLACAGVADVLESETRKSLAELQVVYAAPSHLANSKLLYAALESILVNPFVCGT
jgi:hypothetical protein